MSRLRSGRLRLFCFPYAGGSARVFAAWTQELPEFVEVHPVELPGRGVRFAEPAYDRLEPLVEDVRFGLAPYLSAPYAIFGHSLGALIGWALARQVHHEGGAAPVALLVSGAGAPDLAPETIRASFLPDDQLRGRLGELNGTPREILDDDALMDLLLPVLRADFAVTDTYVYRPGPPLACPIVAFGSTDDPEVSLRALSGWRRHTSSRFAIRLLPGDHFFLHSARPVMLRMVSEELHPYAPSRESTTDPEEELS